jgi:hypothetical protein
MVTITNIELATLNATQAKLTQSLFGYFQARM